jgi:Tfp pilus assembly protein PilN
MAIKTVIGTFVALLAMAGAFIYLSHKALDRNVKYAQDEWKETEPKYKAALQLRADLARKEAVLKQIAGWRESRVAWGKQLEYLQQAVPPSIQLTEMQITHDALLLSNTPSRVFSLRLAGRTSAIHSEANVSDLQDALSRRPPFDQFVDSAVIPPGSFRQDSNVKSDRIFEIVCKYKARPFE